MSTRQLFEWLTSLRSQLANPKRLPIAWVIVFVTATYLWLTFSSTAHILSPKSPVGLRSREAIFSELQNLHSAVSLSEDAVHRQLARFERQVASSDGRVRAQLDLLRAGLEEMEEPDSVVHSSPWPPLRRKVVLIWQYYYVENATPFLSNFDFSHCRVPFCEWTQDRQRFPEADALWFHLPHYPPDEPVPDDHPPPRPTPNQVWIASSQEWESMRCSRARGGYDGYFNWTMSYKRDSDVWWPYGTVVRTANHLKKPRSHWDRLASNAFHSKSVPVLFLSFKKLKFVESRRGEYALQLSNHIQTDILWGGKWLPDSELFAMLRGKYYFVLAFENGLCADYVSEKFWKIGLLYHAVPVVRNGMEREEMARMAPPGSYINAADFGGPRELAEYLTEVASNQTLYASFFEWKKDYSLVFDLEDDIRWSFEMAQGDSTNAWCKVCEKLHSPKLEPKTINFSQTWCHEERGAERYASEHSQCMKAEDLEEGFETVIDDFLNSNHTAPHANSP